MQNLSSKSKKHTSLATRVPIFSVFVFHIRGFCSAQNGSDGLKPF